MGHYSYYLDSCYDSVVSPNNYALVTAAVSPAVELDDVKERLRETQGTNDFDGELLSLIRTATQYGEKLTGRDFINKTYKTYLDCFPSDCQGIRIKKSKLQSITSIQYLVDGVLTTFSSSDYYFTDDNNYSTIYLEENKSWPSNADNKRQAVVIQFVAGYGDDSCDIPSLLKEALISHIVSLFKNKGDCGDDSSMSQYKSLYNTFILPNLLIC